MMSRFFFYILIPFEKIFCCFDLVVLKFFLEARTFKENFVICAITVRKVKLTFTSNNN